MTARGYRLTYPAAAAPGGPPVPSGARPADRLDLLQRHVQEGRGLTTPDALLLVYLARAVSRLDERGALAMLDRILDEPDDADDDEPVRGCPKCYETVGYCPRCRVADTTRRAQ